MQFLYATLGFVALLQPTEPVGWVRTAYSLQLQEQIHFVLAGSTNNTDYDTPFTYSASALTYHRILGDATQSPPWSSKFTPITDDSLTTSESRTVTVPAHKSFERRLYFDKETGLEEWSDIQEETVLVASRTRRWEFNLHLEDWFSQ